MSTLIQTEGIKISVDICSRSFNKRKRIMKIDKRNLKACGTLLFNAGCNEQVILLKPEKRIGADPSCRFREKRTL